MSAKNRLGPPRDPRQVVLLAFDQLCTFEYGVAIEIFGRPRPELQNWYELRVAGIEPGPLRGMGGVQVQPAGGLRLLDSAGTIIVPGWRDVDETPPAALLHKLRRAHAAGARVLSLCSGAVVLGAAGLLDGRRATTHWIYAERLAELCPLAEIDPEVLYVDAGNILTSAGSAAAIDLCLHLVRRDLGAEVANAVARRLVVQPHRGGGQKQFIEAPVAASAESDLAQVLEAVRGQIDQAHTVASMARRAGMSPRTFARRFAQMTGTTPHQWLIGERVRHAQRLLEGSERSLEEIAEASGFADPQSLRLHFRRLVGNPPSVYRRTFRSAS